MIYGALATGYLALVFLELSGFVVLVAVEIARAVVVGVGVMSGHLKLASRLIEGRGNSDDRTPCNRHLQ